MADETAILAGGCFWCTEAIFLDLYGVKSVESGYIGGDVIAPTYKQVCGGDTGHAEAVKIVFDPAELNFGDLMIPRRSIAKATTSAPNIGRRSFRSRTRSWPRPR
jgi:methionine-S-sulfoxide reductase